jgi:pyruvate dehydrogenase E1 component alpha subunit
MDYQPEEERSAAMAADPVPRLREWMIAKGHLTEDDAARIEIDTAAAVNEAVEFALAAPPPAADELYTDVYAEVV